MLSYLLFASCFITLHAMHRSNVGSVPSGGDQIRLKVLTHPDTGTIILLGLAENNNHVYAVSLDDPDQGQGQCSMPSISSALLEQYGFSIFPDPRYYRVIANFIINLQINGNQNHTKWQSLKKGEMVTD
jgi:hypothetical protein